MTIKSRLVYMQLMYKDLNQKQLASDSQTKNTRSSAHREIHDASGKPSIDNTLKQVV